MSKNSSRSFLVGARGSALSRIQTEGALAFLRRTFPETSYRLKTFATPGDRDLATPIEKSAPDFFTRDLDAAVRDGTIDFAVHSAKDLPAEIAPDLDWFWLPDREDPRDAWVTRAGLKALSPRRALRIGISSERRRAYAARCFPRAKLLPIRGAVDVRLEQVRRGDYDAVPMALAGLRRLCPAGIPDLVVEPIALAELAPPEAQGYLAVVFRAGDARLQAMRARFARAVRFVSAGVGDAGFCTRVGAEDLAAADVVLYDDLLGRELLDLAPAGCRLIPVGKRCGAHSMKQPEITRLICDEARKGRRVVRLKGGDAGLFGRLTEETDALTALALPFVVRPGVSALTVATTGTGILLTRRGASRGFTAYTPRSTGTETPQVAFMATHVVVDEAQRLKREGWPAATPCALVREAGGPREEIVRATLGTVKADLRDDRPGLFIVGTAASQGWPSLGWLAGKRVLLTCSDAVMPRAVRRAEDLGGRPVRFPLIDLTVTSMAAARVTSCTDYDAIVLTSPSAVRLFRAAYAGDLRRLPAFYTCGAGTDAALRACGLASDVMPAADFSAAGLVAEIGKLDLRGKNVLRLRSAKAGPVVARALRRAGARVDDVVLYDNMPTPAAPLPPCDAVFFASASAVEVFLDRYGTSTLNPLDVYVIGEPTRAALPPRVAKRAILFPLLEG